MTAPTTTLRTADQAAESWTLVQRAQAGDRQAYAQIYTAYYRAVFNYVWYRTGHRQTAEDIVSETFLKALRTLDTYEWQGKDYGALLTTIAGRLIIDRSRKWHLRCEWQMRGDEDWWMEQADDGPTPEAAVLDSIDNGDLLAAIKELKPAHQRVIVCRFFNEMSLAETATAMGKDVQVVKSLQYRAVHALGRRLMDATPKERS